MATSPDLPRKESVVISEKPGMTISPSLYSGASQFLVKAVEESLLSCANYLISGIFFGRLR